MLSLVTRTKPIADQHDITRDGMSGAVWKQALTSITSGSTDKLGWFILREVLTDDQGSVTLVISYFTLWNKEITTWT